MPGLGLQGGMGAGAAVDELRVLVAEAQRKQMEENRVAAAQAALAENARQFNERQPIELGKLGVAQRGVAVDEGNLGLRGRELDQTVAQTEREGQAASQNSADFEAAIQGLDPMAQAVARANRAGGRNVLSLGDLQPKTAAPPRPIEINNMLRDGKAGTGLVDPTTGQVSQFFETRQPPDRALAFEPLVPVEMSDGTQQYVPRSQAAGMRPATTRRPVLGQERQNLAYFNRAQEAAKVAEPLEPKFSNLASQTRLQYAPNFLQSAEGQQYRQAQRAFTEARLRKESGAAIPNSEYENDAKTYWMQPGDSPEIIAQKKSARQEVLDGLAFSAGSAYQEFYGTPFERKAPSAGGTIGGGSTVQRWERGPDGKLRPVVK